MIREWLEPYTLLMVIVTNLFWFGTLYYKNREIRMLKGDVDYWHKRYEAEAEAEASKQEYNKEIK